MTMIFKKCVVSIVNIELRIKGTPPKHVVYQSIVLSYIIGGNVNLHIQWFPVSWLNYKKNAYDFTEKMESF